MLVTDLIKKLENCNPNAVVIMTIGNEDNDIFSSSEFEVHGEGEKDMEYVDLFANDDAPQQV